MKTNLKKVRLNNVSTPTNELLSNLEEFKLLEGKVIDLRSFEKEGEKLTPDSQQETTNIFNNIKATNLFNTIVTKKELANVDLKEILSLPIIIKDPSDFSLTSISLKIDGVNNKADISTIDGKHFLTIKTPEYIYGKANSHLSSGGINTLKISIDPKVKNRLEKDISTNNLKIKNILSFEYIELVEREHFIEVDLDQPYLNPFIINEVTYDQIVEKL